MLISKLNKYYDYHFEFTTKALKLKCLYELGYYEDIFYSLDFKRHSLKNNITLPGLSKSQFKNFMNYPEKCIKLKLHVNISEIEMNTVKIKY